MLGLGTHIVFRTGGLAQSIRQQQWLANEVFSWMKRIDWKGSTEFRHKRIIKKDDQLCLIDFHQFTRVDTMIRFQHRFEFLPSDKTDAVDIISLCEIRDKDRNRYECIPYEDRFFTDSCEFLGYNRSCRVFVCPAIKNHMNPDDGLQLE